MDTREQSRLRHLIVGMIGGGNMARALVGGGLRARVLEPARVLVSEPDPQRRAAFEAFRVQAFWDNARVARDSDVLVLAIKPQQMLEALQSIRDDLRPHRTLVVSIAAGTTTQMIEAHLPSGTRVVRVMPNAPLLVEAGMSVLCRGANASGADLELVSELFNETGRTLVLDETLFDAVTAVSGSGPAYFYLLVEALADAAVAAGLPAEDARVLAEQTFLGSARLLTESAHSPKELRKMVASPGGTTEAALHVFESAGFGELVRTAVEAAVTRGRELAQR